MSLVKCPNCGKDISDKADRCPHCGYKTGNNPEEKKPKTKKWILISALLIGIFGALLLLGYFATEKQRIYIKAEKYYGEQNYKKAAKLYDSIPDYKDASEKSEKASTIDAYQSAETFYKIKDYESAAKLYKKVGNYKDAKNKKKKCTVAITYQVAEKYFREKQYGRAEKLFSSISGYKDAESQAEQCAHLMGIRDDKNVPVIKGIKEGDIISVNYGEELNLNDYFSSHNIYAEDDVSGKLSKFTFQSAIMSNDDGEVNTKRLGDFALVAIVADEAGNQTSIKLVLRVEAISVPLGQMVNCSLAGAGINISVNGAKKVDWAVWNYDNMPKNGGTAIVSVECAVNNSSENNIDSVGYSLTSSGTFKVLIENNVSAAYNDVIGPKDGQYETTIDLPANTTKYISMPFFINKETSRIMVLLDNKYSVEIPLA